MSWKSIYMPPNASGGQCPNPENESYDIQIKESKLYVWIFFIQEKREFIKKITTIKFPEDDRKIVRYPLERQGKKITYINKKNQFDLASEFMSAPQLSDTSIFKAIPYI